MSIDINKIVEEALAKTTDTELLNENTDSNTDLDTNTNADSNTDDLTVSEKEMLEDISAMNNIALFTSFAAGLGALSLRHNFKNIKEAVAPKKPMNIKKKIGIGVGAGLAAAGAGLAAYKNKDMIGDKLSNAATVTGKAAKQLGDKVGDLVKKPK